MKTSELTGAALDWAVHRVWCEGACHDEPFPSYSTDWAQSGPIIESLGLHINPSMRGDCWIAAGKGALDLMKGPTPLIAAMRCYVASRLGDEVDVPEGVTP